ncbi:spore germination protein [Paenibacillus odorifer]|uniref:Spore germination protein n=1 Tax=Paenibacillus odorifer TaxID=189426 RepID=A0ABX3GEU9_9BACL|nr:spore germination protein [Paenibacillus odorifer]OMD10121.1 spore germination protein [Paenibacillus odorifer]OMD58488.1 spore germination protein [Paenibacillus odorifer]OMD60567.1 spore germination protein [Paenibacillus odorifer]OME02800.1 spore germination protein [Paenibacillus odorifer]
MTTVEERPAGGNSNTSQKNTKSEQTLSTSLDEMMTVFRDIFKNDGTLRIRVFSNMFSDSLRFGLVYVDGMVDKHMIQEGIIKPVMAFDFTEKDCGNKAELMENIRTQVISISDVVASENFDEMIYAIIAGKTLLLMDGYAGVLNIGAQGWETKALAEPVTEKSVKGPREGFTESLLVNLTLIRRRVQDSELKFVFSSLGTRSKTPICICYMEGLASPAILKELQNRMEQIDIDLILDTASLAELIRDEPYSPFEMTGSTERPDAVVSNMMEGRVAVLIEGSPFAMTVPYVFVENFQASSDYYINFYFGSFNRMLRVFGAFLSISIPALYVALVTYSQEMIPTMLLLSISTARVAVPFPTIVEALFMLTIFEILREAGERIPTYIGQAISIVGALVLGQAAVEARIVSAPMIIVVGLTGIMTLLNPRLTGPLIIVRTLLLGASFFLGIYGYFLGMLGLVVHLMSLRSFGVPYMLGVGSIRPQDIKDTAIRAPWWHMYLRPALIGARNMRRKGSNKIRRRP